MLRKNKKTKKWPFVAAAILLLAVVSAGSYYWTQRDNKAPVPAGGVNMEPATEQEKKEAEENKDQLASDITKNNTENPQQNSSTTQKTSEVTITFVGHYGDNIELGAFISGVFENGGTCTATFTKGSNTVTKTSAGFKDVNRTSCTPFSIPRSEFNESGTWKVKVSYSSATTNGQSSERTFEVK